MSTRKPPKTVPVHIRVPVDLLAQIDRIGRQYDRDRTYLIIKWVQRGVKDEKDGGLE